MIVRTTYIGPTLVQRYKSNPNQKPNVGPTNDSQRIQAANDSADYIHWPNVGPTHDSQCIQAANDSADYTNWPYVGPTNDS